MKGKITLPNMIEPPALLRGLFNGVDPRSAHFIGNIRSYNSLFSFTSMGGKVETRLNQGAGPPHFAISGQNYHRIGSLLPAEGQPPKFCQLYIYDTENELVNRLSHFRWVNYSMYLFLIAWYIRVGYPKSKIGGILSLFCTGYILCCFPIHGFFKLAQTL
jgi:hypothetical protein